MKKLLLTLGLLLSFAVTTQAQIARDSTTAITTQFGTSSCNINHTISGSNRILFVYLLSTESFMDDIATFDGVNMILVQKVLTPSDLWNYMWYIVAPNTGTHQVHMSGSPDGVQTIGACVISAQSYTGAAQTSPIDASTTNTATATGITTSVTTTTTGAWTIMSLRVAAAVTLTPGSGANDLTSDGAFGYGLYDSNGTVSVGSVSMTVTWGSSNAASTVMAAFCPASGCGGGGGGGATRPCFGILLGVGKCHDAVIDKLSR